MGRSSPLADLFPRAAMADQFRQRFARKHGIEVHGISNACSAALQKHDWPGNVRELQNVVERGVILCNEGGILEPAHLGLGQTAALSAAFPSSSAATSRATNGFGSEDSGDFPPLSEVEKRHILAALEQSKGNRTHAAKVLGISIRTLRNKLNEYNYRGAESASARD